MRLLSLHVENFGALQGFDLSPAEGLNVLYQKNGWGKSTLAVFIKAMLYGIGDTKKTSLDELPQLFNVLIGTMSLVGPRPVLYEETLLYGENRDLLLKVKPGITGLWQVSGRNNISYANGERQAIELEYVEKRSFFFDIKILILTVGAVFKMKGAM